MQSNTFSFCSLSLFFSLFLSLFLFLQALDYSDDEKEQEAKRKVKNSKKKKDNNNTGIYPNFHVLTRTRKHP